MKLGSKDLENACSFIMHEILKNRYGDEYVEKGFTFKSIDKTPTTVREIIDAFLVWLKIRIKEEKNTK